MSLGERAHAMVEAAGVEGCSGRNHVWAYGNGCRCAACTEAVRLYNRLRRERLKDDGPPPGFTHGLGTSYISGCHCRDCRVAYNAYRAAFRRRKREVRS